VKKTFRQLIQESVFAETQTELDEILVKIKALPFWMEV